METKKISIAKRLLKERKQRSGESFMDFARAINAIIETGLKGIPADIKIRKAIESFNENVEDQRIRDRLKHLKSSTMETAIFIAEETAAEIKKGEECTGTRINFIRFVEDNHVGWYGDGS